MAREKWFVSWDVKPHPEGVSKQWLEDTDRCGSDAVVIASITYPQAGGLSTMICSVDGRTEQPVEDRELFKVWASLARKLGESKGLPEGERSLCAEVFEVVRRAILAGREKG